MIKRERKSTKFLSIRFVMLYTMLIGLALAILLFFCIRLLSVRYINNQYLSEQSIQQREDNYIESLQKYITDNDLSSTDTNKISKWVKQNKYLYILLYKDDKLFFESGSFDEEKNEDGEEGATPTEPEDTDSSDSSESGIQGGLTVQVPTREELLEYAESKNAHLITMKDGDAFVSIADYSEYLYYDVMNTASIIVAIIAFVIVMMIYFHGVTARISKLGAEVTRVAYGDKSYIIQTSGRDEIGKLSCDVENMRSSIVESLEKEKTALNANTELITAMSHDIRTPLTVLLGYLDMMKTRSEDETMNEYIRASEKTALRLKKMSDDMFNYFRVFSLTTPELKIEKYNAATLLEQLFSEYLLLLGEQGYNVDFEAAEIMAMLSDCQINTDAPHLARIFENIFSNIFKYADRDEPIVITMELTSNRIQLRFKNKIAPASKDTESNRIGLKTCRKIAEAMEIDFNYYDNDQHFYTNVDVPYIKADNVNKHRRGK